MSVDDTRKKIFVSSLLKWRVNNRRDFPWRKTRDPFRILVAELMLQRTNAQQVEPIYLKFLERYPSPNVLSITPVSEIAKSLYSLGLAYRASRFRQIGEIIMVKFNGQIPCDARKLRELPGVGRYIANAVLCFAFGKDVPLVDSNFVRILRRVFSITIPSSPHKKKELWDIMQGMIPRGQSRDFNLSILDFASGVCKAKAPKHNACPLTDICDCYLTTK